MVHYIVKTLVNCVDPKEEGKLRHRLVKEKVKTTQKKGYYYFVRLHKGENAGSLLNVHYVERCHC